MDMLGILDKTTLKLIDDETLKAIFTQYDRPGWHCVAVLVAAEYGRILGKREERAKNKKRVPE